MDKQHGLIAKFDTPAGIMHAAEKVRDAGFKKWDVITPFPIHGLDSAMGLKRSVVGRFTICGGTFGLTAGMLMIWFTGGSELSLPFMDGYKLIVGGKPYFSPQFAFPVSYEMTILFSAFASIGGMFILNRLPRHHHPVLKYKDVRASSDDKFFLYIENEDPQFDDEKTRVFLNELEPVEVGELEE